MKGKVIFIQIYLKVVLKNISGLLKHFNWFEHPFSIYLPRSQQNLVGADILTKANMYLA